MAAAATVGKLTGYLGGGASNARLRAVIYADSGGAPDALVGVTREVTLPVSAAPGWVDFALSTPLVLAPGRYWLGYWYGGGAHEYFDSIAGSERYAAASYSSTGPPATSFGASASSHGAYSLYASYVDSSDAGRITVSPPLPASTPDPAPISAVLPSASTAMATSQSQSPSSSTSTALGQTSVGALRTRGGANYLDASGPYTLVTAAKVGKLTGYLSGGSSSTKLRAVIYADRAGAPGGRVGATREVTLPAGAAPGWVDFTFREPLALAPGQYWLGYWYGGKQFYAYYDSIAGSERLAPADYSSDGNPPSPYGASLSSACAYSLYASYTGLSTSAGINLSPPLLASIPEPSPPLASIPEPPPLPPVVSPAAMTVSSSASTLFGPTSIGALRTRSGANYLDASGPYTLATAAKVRKLAGYLSGGNSSTKLRAVIYADRAGAPGGRVGATREVTLPAGAAPGWVDFTFREPLALAPGAYWLGYWYGGKQVYAYYDSIAGSERFAPADYSSDGNPPSPFGTPQNSSSAYSLYAS